MTIQAWKRRVEHLKSETYALYFLESGPVNRKAAVVIIAA
jgi:hypothetical protein